MDADIINQRTKYEGRPRNGVLDALASARRYPWQGKVNGVALLHAGLATEIELHGYALRMSATGRASRGLTGR